MNTSGPVVLGSTSPRRQFLLKEIGFSFTIERPDADETFSPDMPLELVPAFLAKKKAISLRERSGEHIVITADTVVILGDAILNKPADESEAVKMLNALSGKTHKVITAVCLMTREKLDEFEELTSVTFRSLGPEEITKYVLNYHPLDKAGAYGAQECLPMGFNPCSGEEVDFLEKIGRRDLAEKSMNRKPGYGLDAIKKIEGSYFNVMGLPVHRVYEHLRVF